MEKLKVTDEVLQIINYHLIDYSCNSSCVASTCEYMPRAQKCEIPGLLRDMNKYLIEMEFMEGVLQTIEQDFDIKFKKVLSENKQDHFFYEEYVIDKIGGTDGEDSGLS